MTPAARRRAYAEFLLWGESVRGLAPETMRVYQLWLDKAHAALAADGVDLRHATRRHLLGYYQTARPTAATRTLIRKALRCYYDWLIDLEQRDDNPADRLPVMRARRGVPKPLTPAEVGRLEAAARDAGPRWVVAVALMLYTGLRAGEVVALRWEDVEGDWLRVTGKGGHTRTLPVHPRLAEALAAWGEECPSDVWVLPAGHRPGHLHNQVLRNKVRALGDAAGVEGLHPHRCRHTYGTWVMNAT